MANNDPEQLRGKSGTSSDRTGGDGTGGKAGGWQQLSPKDRQARIAERRAARLVEQAAAPAAASLPPRPGPAQAARIRRAARV
ncbi:MAG: hypothetical protein ACK414_00005 [Gemmobacter sp.]